MTYTYVGPLATAVFVAGAFNDATARAKTATTSASAKYDLGDSLITSLPTVPASDAIVLTGYDALATRIAVAQAAETRAQAEFVNKTAVRDTLSAAVLGPVNDFQNKLATDIGTFFTTFFPGALAANKDALQVMADQVKYGSITIRRSVATLQFEKERDAILRDRQKKEHDILAKYSGKRFALPPGALLDHIADVHEDAQRAIGEASNKIAIDQFNAELAATRKYVDLALDYRNKAVDQFGDYMTRWCVLRFDQATMEADEQDRFRRSLHELFLKDQMAAVEAELWTRKLVTENFGLNVTAASESEANRIKAIELRFESAMANAQRLSTIAATAFNVMRGGAAISSSES